MSMSAPRPAVPMPPAPPVADSADGRTRRVGVEVEFGDLMAVQAAEVVRAVFGGTVHRRDAHALDVVDTPHGPFSVELDSRYAHPDASLGKLGEMAPDRLRRRLGQWVREAGQLTGDVIRHWLPTEVVCPPLPWTALGEVDRLVDALRAAGASGTREQPWYAFGLQLNPELPGRDAATLRRHLQAFALAEDWLRARIHPDRARVLLPFIDPWPAAYRRRVLAPGYAPGLDGLCADYLAENASRNRGLDMLPAFLELCPEAVRRVAPDPLIKARPTFHYRLPDASFAAAPEGGEGPVVRAWARWLVVERLAADATRLDALAAAWRANDRRLLAEDWARLAEPVLAPLAGPEA